MTHSLHHRRRLTMHLFLGGMFRRILTACFERMFSEANSRRTRSVRSNFTKLGTTEDDEDEVYYDACSWSMDECHQTSQELICDKRRKISWGTVQVRTFPNIVGDNPEAKGAGPPVRNHYDFRKVMKIGYKENSLANLCNT